METVNGVTDVDKGGPPPPSPLTGCYLLIVVGEPHSEQHKDIILQRIAKGLLSWDLTDCLVDLEKELAIITEQALEGEEARYGERLIQFASENLVTEILIHPVVSTLAQCMRNLLSSFTRHRHIIHAGYTFASNGSWALQDGTFSSADFSEAFQELEVQRVIRAYENGISLDLHCSPEGDWSRLPKEPFAKACKVRVNPTDVLTTGSPSITEFINYISPFLLPTSLENLLESSDVVGNIRFSRPTLYVFPGGQGDAALFGINGFNMLLDGGFSRKACFWDFVRHLDRLDAVLMTRLNNSNVGGISSVLRRKKQDAVYPQIGHFFCNIQERKALLSPDGDKDKDPLLINLMEEGQEIISNLRHLNLNPQVCYRDSEPINLYHKVGHGTLDMYVLSPAKDSKEVREFLLKWNQSDQKLFANSKSSREFSFPIQNLISIAALLVWQPANPNDTITRILFPGSSPQRKVFEGLDRLKNLEFIKHSVCTDKSLVPSSLVKKAAKDSIMEKVIPKEKVPVDKKENKIIENNISQNGEVKEKTVKKSDSTESERSTRAKKTEDKIIENGEKPKAKPKPSKVKSDAQQKRKTIEKKSSPTTPKKTVENGEAKKPTKPSPIGTPAKSTKDANNRKVIESKTRSAKPPPAEPKPKVERKPISRRPKGTMKAPISPVKKLVNGVQKPDTISKKGKLDKEGTTDSSTVSTPSADQESLLKKDISKLTPEEIQQMKAQELADLKEEQEAVKEIEAVFRKGEVQPEKDENLRKVKDISIDEDKLEKEEYLIIEKEEIDHDSLDEKETKEDETQKLARDSEESEKQRKMSAEEKIVEKQQDIEEQVNNIVNEAEDIVKAKEDTAEVSKETVVTSPEEKLDVSSTDKKTTDKEVEEEVKDVVESQPDEKVSANIKSGDTTTAPTLPEDERIPLDEIKEDSGQIIEEKHVKEETKEKEVPVIQLPPKTFETVSKVPGVVGIRLDKQSHIRDIVKTPDEVADLPVHEEVDYEYTHELKAEPKTNEIIEEKKDDKIDEKMQEFIKDTEEAVGYLKEQAKEIEQEKDKDEVMQAQLKDIIEDVNKTAVMQEELKTLTNEVLESETVLEKDTEKPADVEKTAGPTDIDHDELDEQPKKLAEGLQHKDLVVEKQKTDKDVSTDISKAQEKEHVESQGQLQTEDILEKAELETKEKLDVKTEESKEEKGTIEKEETEKEQLEVKEITEEKESKKEAEDIKETVQEKEILKEDVKQLEETEIKTKGAEDKQEIIEKDIAEKEEIIKESIIEKKTAAEDESTKELVEMEESTKEKADDKETVTITQDTEDKEEHKEKDEKEKNDEDRKVDSPKEPIETKESTTAKVDDKEILSISKVAAEDGGEGEKEFEEKPIQDESKEIVDKEELKEEKRDLKHVDEKVELKKQELPKDLSEEPLVNGEVLEEEDKIYDFPDKHSKLEKPIEKGVEKVETEKKMETKEDIDKHSKLQEKPDMELEENADDKKVGDVPSVQEVKTELIKQDEEIVKATKEDKAHLEKIDEKLQHLKEKSPEPKIEIIEPKKLEDVSKTEQSELVKGTKDGKDHLEKLEEKLLQLKEAGDQKFELKKYPEGVADSEDEKDQKLTGDIIEKVELGRKSPKEREEDVIKIVASVAEVLKSDAPLEEFEGKLPISTYSPYTATYTTELRETHITTVDSPIVESKAIKIDGIPPIPEEPSSASASLLDEERKIAPIHEGEPSKDDKRSSLLKESQELMMATSKMISEIKSAKGEEKVEEADDVDESGIVHRMLVTTSSEDGGEEIEICPVGTITFSKSSESSGRSSPEKSQELSKKSSIVDTISDSLSTVKQVVELHSEKDSGIDDVKSDTDLESQEKSSSPPHAEVVKTATKEIESISPHEKSEEIISQTVSGKSSPDKDASIKSLASGKSTPDMSDFEKSKEITSSYEDLKKADDLLKKDAVVEAEVLSKEISKTESQTIKDEAKEIDSTKGKVEETEILPKETAKSDEALPEISQKVEEESVKEHRKDSIIEKIEDTIKDQLETVSDFTKSLFSKSEKEIETITTDLEEKVIERKEEAKEVIREAIDKTDKTVEDLKAVEESFIEKVEDKIKETFEAISVSLPSFLEHGDKKSEDSSAAVAHAADVKESILGATEEAIEKPVDKLEEHLESEAKTDLKEDKEETTKDAAGSLAVKIDESTDVVKNILADQSGEASKIDVPDTTTLKEEINVHKSVDTSKVITDGTDTISDISKKTEVDTAHIDTPKVDERISDTKEKDEKKDTETATDLSKESALEDDSKLSDLTDESKKTEHVIDDTKEKSIISSEVVSKEKSDDIPKVDTDTSADEISKTIKDSTIDQITDLKEDTDKLKDSSKVAIDGLDTVPADDTKIDKDIGTSETVTHGIEKVSDKEKDITEAITSVGDDIKTVKDSVSDKIEEPAKTSVDTLDKESHIPERDGADDKQTVKDTVIAKEDEIVKVSTDNLDKAFETVEKEVKDIVKDSVTEKVEETTVKVKDESPDKVSDAEGKQVKEMETQPQEDTRPVQEKLEEASMDADKEKIADAKEDDLKDEAKIEKLGKLDSSEEAPVDKPKKRRESIVEQLEEGVKSTFSALAGFGKSLFDKGEKVIEDTTSKAEHVVEDIKTTTESIVEKIGEDIKSSIETVQDFEKSLLESSDKAEEDSIVSKGIKSDEKEIDAKKDSTEDSKHDTAKDKTHTEKDVDDEKPDISESLIKQSEEQDTVSSELAEKITSEDKEKARSDVKESLPAELKLPTETREELKQSATDIKPIDEKDVKEHIAEKSSSITTDGTEKKPEDKVVAAKDGVPADSKEERSDIADAKPKDLLEQAPPTEIKDDKLKATDAEVLQGRESKSPTDISGKSTPDLKSDTKASSPDILSDKRDDQTEVTAADKKDVGSGSSPVAIGKSSPEIKTDKSEDVLESKGEKEAAETVQKDKIADQKVDISSDVKDSKADEQIDIKEDTKDTTDKTVQKDLKSESKEDEDKDQTGARKDSKSTIESDVQELQGKHSTTDITKAFGDQDDDKTIKPSGKSSPDLKTTDIETRKLSISEHKEAKSPSLSGKSTPEVKDLEKHTEKEDIKLPESLPLESISDAKSVTSEKATKPVAELHEPREAQDKVSISESKDDASEKGISGKSTPEKKVDDKDDKVPVDLTVTLDKGAKPVVDLLDPQDNEILQSKDDAAEKDISGKTTPDKKVDDQDDKVPVDLSKKDVQSVSPDGRTDSKDGDESFKEIKEDDLKKSANVITDATFTATDAKPHLSQPDERESTPLSDLITQVVEDQKLLVKEEKILKESADDLRRTFETVSDMLSGKHEKLPTEIESMDKKLVNKEEQSLEKFAENTSGTASHMSKSVVFDKDEKHPAEVETMDEKSHKKEGKLTDELDHPLDMSKSLTFEECGISTDIEEIDPKLLEKEQMELKTSAEGLKEAYDTVSKLAKSLSFEKCEKPEDKILQKEESELEARAEELKDTFETLTDMSKSVVFEKCEGKDEIDPKLLEKEEIAIKKTAEDIKEAYDTVSKLSTSLSFEKCENPEDKILQKEEKELEARAEELEESFETLTDMSKSVVFEKCERRDEIDPKLLEKEEKAIEKSAESIKEAYDTVSKLSTSLSFEKCEKPEDKILQKEEKELEARAEELEETFETLTDMSKSVVFEKCEGKDEIDPKLLKKEEKAIEKSAESLKEAYDTVSKLSSSLSFDKCEKPESKTLQKEEKELEACAEELKETYEILTDMSKSVVFEKCEEKDETDPKLLEKEEKAIEKSAESLKEAYDTVSKLSKSLSFEKCEKPEEKILKKEERELEDCAEELKETLETLTDMSQSVVFEKCEPTEDKKKSLADELLEDEHKEKSDSEKELYDEKSTEHAKDTVVKDIIDKVTADIDTKSISAEIKSPKDLPGGVASELAAKKSDITEVIDKVTADIDTKSIEAEFRKSPELLVKDNKLQKSPESVTSEAAADSTAVFEKCEKETMEKVTSELKDSKVVGAKPLEDNELKDLDSKETLPPLEKEIIKDEVKTLDSRLGEKEILETKSTLDIAQAESKKLSISDVEISLTDAKVSTDEALAGLKDTSTKLTEADKKSEKGDIKNDKQKTESKDTEDSCDKAKESLVSEKIPVSVAGPSTLEKTKDLSEISDVAELEKQQELQDTLLHEKHIPGAVTPPTVPVSPNIVESYGDDVKLTSRTEALIKEMGLRSSTPGSDDFEIVTSTQSDISSGQVSKVPLDSEKFDSDEEDPLSVTSQVAHSRDSSHYDLDEDAKIGAKIDPMSMSFYGALPEDDAVELGEKQPEPTYLYEITKAKFSSGALAEEADVKLDQINKNKQSEGEGLMTASFIGELPSSSTGDEKKDPIESWGKPLGRPVINTYLYEITQARTTAEPLRMSAIEREEMFQQGESRKETLNSFSDRASSPREDQDVDYQNEQVQNVMTASFYGGSHASFGDDKDPIASWGKPLGLPSPAPPNDNKGTPKKERKLPPNVTAKNKLNDDKKRAESPSKYKNKKVNPVYVDLTYVPHHGNSYYSYVDFFKRVRARYYVFSGIEPSRDVYNALLEAKQTWEDKELEVTIIPTYDTDILGYWVAENEELLTKYKIDLSPSASRCTINLQDHETSCSAYRLEF